MSTGRFVLVRLGWGLVLVLVVTALVFVIFNVLPTEDPAVAQAGPGATAAQVESIRESFGLDQPVYRQYLDFVGDLARFDLGTSYRYGVPVSELIVDRLPATLLLIAGGVVVWLVVGVMSGVLGAANRRSRGDRLAGFLSLLLISTPAFVLGYIALLLFASGTDSLLPILPGIGAYLEADDLPSRLAAMILPWMVLGLSSAAVYFRLTRAAVSEELERGFVVAARARGITERRIRWRHAAWVGSAPILTLLGLDIALIAAGNVVLVEAVFNIPGVGGLMVSSIERADLPVIEGIVLLSAIAIVTMNVAIDLAQAALDPRVKLQGASRRRRRRGGARPARGPSTSS